MTSLELPYTSIMRLSRKSAGYTKYIDIFLGSYINFKISEATYVNTD